MYDELLRAMEQYFDEVKVLKRGARGTVTLVRHRQTGQRYVFRRFDGAADVYRRLLTVSSPYLPRVEEVAESHGRVAALDFPPRKARRMEDLGFLPGQQVTALHTPPFGGITAYQVLDTVIALRDTDASRITLYTLQDEKDDVL